MDGQKSVSGWVFSSKVNEGEGVGRKGFSECVSARVQLSR